MINTNPLLGIDAYKLGHMSMYPNNTTKVYCNFTPRSFRHLRGSLPNNTKRFFENKAVVFGTQAVIKELHESFESSFFSRDIEEIMKEFVDTVTTFVHPQDLGLLEENIRKLHKLQYLPLEFKGLDEGTQVKEGIPILTWTNTHNDFAWLPNFLETTISAQLWKLVTAATIAKIYKNIFDYYAKATGIDPSVTAIQGHDFSSRGMSGIVDASRTGAAHLTSFIGTDAISAISFIKRNYPTNDLLGISVPATEHSVMAMGGKSTELDTYRRLIKKYNSGILSVVSDTWDYWKLLTEGVPALKEDILNRTEQDGLCKFVIRPDSGDPVDIICGTKVQNGTTAEEKGSIELLAEIFGTTTTDKGYKELNSKIGLIYGDSITPGRAVQILETLKLKGFASSNIVMGIGSYTYQYMTRDTLGIAVKATAAVINDNLVKIFKEPKTDAGKRSAKGYLRVDVDPNGDYVLTDDLNSHSGGELKPRYYNGSFPTTESFTQIRKRLTT